MSELSISSCSEGKTLLMVCGDCFKFLCSSKETLPSVVGALPGGAEGDTVKLVCAWGAGVCTDGIISSDVPSISGAVSMEGIIDDSGEVCKE